MLTESIDKEQLNRANIGSAATGGRVLNVTATGESVSDAKRHAYALLDQVEWDNGFCRRDIGWRAVEREKA